jgi:PhnB protein
MSSRRLTSSARPCRRLARHKEYPSEETASADLTQSSRSCPALWLRQGLESRTFEVIRPCGIFWHPMSTTQDNRVIQPYLFFNGSCEQAVDFYRKALGAEVQMMMRYKESPEPPPPGRLPPGFENKIMHTSFRIGQTTVMASDGCSADKAKFEGFSLALSVGDEAEARRAFNGLAEGGKVHMPLAKTFWSPCFGMVEDRFGIGWMISVASAEQHK